MKMKRLLILLLTVLLLTVFAAAVPAGAEEKRRVTSPEEASAFVRALFGEDPASLDGAFVLTPVLEQTLAVYGGWQGIALQLAALGPLIRTDAAYEGTLQGYRIFYVPCVFTAMPLDIWIVMDGDAVAQVLTGDYTGRPGETAAFEEIDLPLPVPALNGALPGTLTLPAGEGPFPAVVLVHGSGPSDRDESIGALKPFRDLAQGLAERGIAVYRYDKRTWVYPVQCAADQGATLMDETADDAAAAVRLLAEQEAIDPERVFVLGHSLGATAVPAVAGCFDGGDLQPRGYILLAASPRSMSALMREQYTFLYSLVPGLTPAEQAEKDAVFAALDQLDALYAAEPAQRAALPDEDSILGVYLPYWKWLADYDMIAAAKRITAPCLVLQGEEDYQVTMEDFTLLLNALGDLDNWRFISYPGLTHPFTPGGKQEGSAAYARPEKVAPAVMDDIAAFILAN